jgi:hypothetical protein
MRLIKFRYTFKNVIQTIQKYFTLQEIEQGFYQEWFETIGCENGYKLISKDQSSGMLDKNNREIFESDKYKWRNNRKEKEVGTIIFSDGGFWCQSENGRYPLYAMATNLEIIDN